MEQPAVSARTSPRHRPLETCGAAIISTARVFYTRSQNAKNPTARFANNAFRAALCVASFTSPFHRHLLAMLSVADDNILALQETLETRFPSSRFFSSKIQDLLVIAEALPEKLDNAMEKVPGLIDHSMALDWILALAIYGLDCLAGVLTRVRDKNMKEKEITVDKSFSRSDSVFLDAEEEKPEPETRRETYKEVLQKENVEEDDEPEPENAKATYKEALQKGNVEEHGSDDDDNDGDPILELFETGWILNPKKRSFSSADSV